MFDFFEKKIPECENPEQVPKKAVKKTTKRMRDDCRRPVANTGRRALGKPYVWNWKGRNANLTLIRICERLSREAFRFAAVRGTVAAWKGGAA